MVRNVYDQASRYLAKLDPRGFLAWLLQSAVIFHRWLDTRRLPYPGEPDRTCDTVAELEDPAVPWIRWAVPLEFMLEPSPLFGRLLAYLGLLWEEQRPDGERGDRYQVGAIVVNLTGQGHTSRDMAFGATDIRTCLGVCERNMTEKEAAATLAGIASGTIPRCVLALIPLMQGGDDNGNIQQWVQLASAEPDARLRGDYGGLALVFAEAVGRRDLWKQALKGWNMVQSLQVLEWMAEGKVEGKVETLLEVLALRFGSVPPDLASSIRATTDLTILKQWVAAAVGADTLDTFRLKAKI